MSSSTCDVTVSKKQALFTVVITRVFPSAFTMARLRVYDRVLAAPGGRSFYSNPRKRARKPRAPVNSSLKETFKARRETRREEYASALADARQMVRAQAIRLRETFGRHTIDYYEQEILQGGRLTKGHQKASGWNTYLQKELKAHKLQPNQYIYSSF
jgi:hypothetical protein